MLMETRRLCSWWPIDAQTIVRALTLILVNVQLPVYRRFNVGRDVILCSSRAWP